MIPILYESNETFFNHNGLGRLRDCVSCTVTEERNGVYECDFEYPVDGQHYDLIQLGRIIAVEHDDTNDVQPFDIVSYTRPIDGVVEFHAVHISYRQSKMVANGKNINSLADAFTMLSNATPSNPFTYDTDLDGATGYMAAADGVPKSVRSFLGGVEGSILDTYRGEYEWDKFTVKLWQARGEEKSFTIRYGVDLTDYNEEVDCSESYSAVIPYWTGGDDITVVGSKVTVGESAYSGREECVPLDLSEKFENRPTTAQLTDYAQSYLNSHGTTLPSQNITVSFVQLDDSASSQALSYLFKCRLCDTVKVVFPRYNMSGRFKIVKTVYNVLLERFDEMELGTLSVTLSEALGIENGFGSSNGSDSGIVDHYGAISGASIADKSLSSGSSWQNIGSITLPDGAWLLYLTAVFASNGSGYRQLAVADQSAAAGTVIRTVRRAPTNGAATTVDINCPLEGGKTYYINGIQNSGSALTVQTRYTAVKIGKNYTA